MTMIRFSRLMEMIEREKPNTQLRILNRELSSFEEKDVYTILEILSLDLKSNNVGLARAKKWLANIFSVFEDEIHAFYVAHEDLGEAIYYLDPSAETQQQLPITQAKGLLNMDCSKLDSNSYSLMEYAITNMSSLERKWFLRYWIRLPRIGINEGLIAKLLAKYFNKQLSVTKKHLNYNPISVVFSYYSMNEEPPTKLTHGKFIKPMLAKEVSMRKWPKNRIVDYKYDGNRYQIHKENDNVIIFNRKGNIVTPQFQDVVEAVKEYEVDCILDGEIYPIKDDGSPAEHKLMGTRVHSKNHEEAREKVKVKWVIFDCLKIGNETIMDLPYSTRMVRMSKLPDQAHRMEEGGDVLAFYNRAINDGFEGIIVKDATLPYEAGKRSAGWAKYKPPRIELDVVILSAQYGDGARSNVFGTFEIGVKSDKGYISVGNIGTGFTETQLIRLTSELRKNVESYSNNRYYFLPRTVLEVNADIVTNDAKGNIGLRFPRVSRIRDDKFVSDINTIEDVRSLM